MKLVVFGLALSSSWGNGHATLWRGLVRALARRGVAVTFFERDRPWYAAARDMTGIEGGDLVIYPDWSAVGEHARREIHSADAVVVTSYCPDARTVTKLLADVARPVRVFYDLDTPVTLAADAAGGRADWIGPDLLSPFDLVLSYTGGSALDRLQSELRARRVAPLYGHVDPELHRPAAPRAEFRGDLSYIGTWAVDRQHMLDALFLEPARRAPERTFVLAGAQYPSDFPWRPNIRFVQHLPPALHPAFFASSRASLNVTRRVMAENGWCPSARLFEAAACGTPIVTDAWPGLSEFLAPGREILVANAPWDVLAALDRDDRELARIAEAARARTLAEHTSDRRAEELIDLLGETRSGNQLKPATAARTAEEVSACGA